jgi:hypothetical protein
VAAIALNALVASFDDAPDVSVSREAAYHADTVPQPLSAAGTPATVSAPIRSLFQTDCIGIKLSMQASWGLRATGAVAVISSGLTW